MDEPSQWSAYNARTIFVRGLGVAGWVEEDIVLTTIFASVLRDFLKLRGAVLLTNFHLAPFA